MYFGSRSVKIIRVHLDGWQAHRRFVVENDLFADLFFDGFHEYVESRYNDTRTIGWDGLIAENARSENEEYILFMEFLRDFAGDKFS